MPTLAPKLPWNHPFAGGYPRLGGQPLPTDPDAIDYLNRVAAADGAAVEVGVAMAVDAFFKDLKATPGLFDAIKASCILCGARTLTGALVPMVGTAPTNVANGFVSGDYSRTAGLTGDQTSYLDSGRASNDDPQDDAHFAVFPTSLGTVGKAFIGTDYTAADADANGFFFQQDPGTSVIRSRRGADQTLVVTYLANKLIGASRSSGTGYSRRYNGATEDVVAASYSPDTTNHFVFARNNAGSAELQSDATIAFYSIGTSLDLAALDTAVDNLITDIGNAL